jgi:hypothetical protein
MKKKQVISLKCDLCVTSTVEEVPALTPKRAAKANPA